MKNLVILFILLWSHFATAQEYKIYEFGEGLPKSTISERNVYSFDSFGTRSDFPKFKYREVNSNRVEVFSVDKYGVENFEPLIIKRENNGELHNKQRTDKTIKKHLRSRDELFSFFGQK